MRNKAEQKQTHVVSVRLTDDIKREVESLVSEYPYMTQVDIIRIALDIGMRDMRDAQLNLPELIRAQAEANRAAAAVKPKKEK